MKSLSDFEGIALLSESSLGLENLLQGDLVTWLVSWHVDYNLHLLQKEKDMGII